MISGRVDAIVVGAGVIGLATAHELAGRGKSALCFEQGAPGQGQSAGDARTFRNVHDTPEMTRRAQRARAAWRRLEGQLGETLIGGEGMLVYGGLRGERRRQSPSEAESKLPRETVPGTPAGEVLFDDDAGVIRADRVCSRLADSLGATLKRGRVLGLRPHGSGVEVQTSVGTWSCDTAIVAAGIHTAALASVHGVRVPVRHGVHAQISFELLPGVEPPCFLDRSGEFDERTYGLPVPGRREMAVGLDHCGDLLEVVMGDVLPPGSALREVEARIVAYVEKAFPKALGSPTSSRLCVFTPLGTDSDAFSAWQAGPLTFAAGHNAFKFAPLIAAELASVCEGGPLPEALIPAA
jgi:sarcosine oxidase